MNEADTIKRIDSMLFEDGPRKPSVEYAMPIHEHAARPETVPEARARLIVERTEPGGIVCPCCDQRAAERPRVIHKSMAEGLRKFEKYSGVIWGKPIEMLSTRENADFAKLRYWELIEAAPAGALGGHASVTGVWRVSSRGLKWLHNMLRVPRAVRIYNGHFCGFVDADDLVGVHDVLPFDKADIERGVR